MSQLGAACSASVAAVDACMSLASGGSGVNASSSATATLSALASDTSALENLSECVPAWQPDITLPSLSARVELEELEEAATEEQRACRFTACHRLRSARGGTTSRRQISTQIRGRTRCLISTWTRLTRKLIRKGLRTKVRILCSLQQRCHDVRGTSPETMILAAVAGGPIGDRARRPPELISCCNQWRAGLGGNSSSHLKVKLVRHRKRERERERERERHLMLTLTLTLRVCSTTPSGPFALRDDQRNTFLCLTFQELTPSES